MQYKQIVQGQRDWLNQLNQALSYIGRPYEETDAVTLLDGWMNGEHTAKLKKYPLPSGSTLVVFQFEVHKMMAPGPYGNFAAIPEGYNPSLNFPLGGQIPVNYGGHIGGYIDLYAIPGQIGYKFWPNNGEVDPEANKQNDVTVRGAIAWI